MSRPVYRRAELSAQYFDIKSANPNFSDVAHAIALTRNVVEEVTAYYEAKIADITLWHETELEEMESK